MKKVFTTFIILFSVLMIYGQDDVIRNGGFEMGTENSNWDHDIEDWYIDKDSVEGWWGDALDRHVTLASGDSATLYQVVEVISADSVLYELSLSAADSWNTASLIVIISTSDADSSMRTILKADTIDITSETFGLTFGFSENSEYVGKKLIVELGCTALDETGAWCNVDDVVMIKRLPGVNNPPTADAGDDQSVKGGELVTLDGSASADPDEDPLTYTWISTFPGITLSDPTAVAPTFTAPDVSELSSYLFALYVNDGEVNSDTVLTKVTVIPAGELIRNGGFSERVPGSDPESNSLKDVLYWNIDEPRDSISGGIWGPMVTLASVDANLYQVVDVLENVDAVYSLSFSARSSWNSHSVDIVVSISEADSSARIEMASAENLMAIDPPGGINTSEYAIFKQTLAVPAALGLAGKSMILELDNVAYDDGNDDGWAEVEFVSLVKTVNTTHVPTNGLNDLTLYPNPASDIIYIGGDLGVSRVEIYSILGTKVRSKAGKDITQVNVEELKSGMYIISLTTQQGAVNHKLQIK